MITRILKSRNEAECSNYRQISPLYVIINVKLKKFAELKVERGITSRHLE